MPDIRLTVLSDSAAEVRGRLLYGGPGTAMFVGTGSNNFVCGRCGSKLAQGCDVLPVENGALKCNGCGEFNDLTRPAKYPILPAMLRDIRSLPPAKLRDWIDEPWEISPHTAQLKGLNEAFRADWMREQGDPPAQIFHYTSPQGLRGILSSHQLWATDIAYMNDASEMEYGLAIVREAVDRVAASVTDLGKELLRRSDIAGSTLTLRGDFVACFCADGDLLSQWRSYAAAGSGYAIGFSTHALVEHNQPILRRVIYDETLQRRLIESAVSTCLAAFQQVTAGRPVKALDDDRTLPAFASFVASRLKEFAFTFKHSGFREENEWRLIFRGFKASEYMAAVRFRDDALSTPYIPISLRNANSGAPILPIVEVGHGPSVHPGLARKSLLLLLEKAGYDHVEVRGSRTPLRA